MYDQKIASLCFENSENCTTLNKSFLKKKRLLEHIKTKNNIYRFERVPQVSKPHMKSETSVLFFLPQFPLRLGMKYC